MTVAKKINIKKDSDATETEGRIDNVTSLSDYKSAPIKNNPIYKIKNHQELFKIGKSFLKDYRMRTSSFAIASAGYMEAQRKTVLGLASYFDQVLTGVSILVICDGIDEKVFKDMIDVSNVEQFDFDHEIAIQVYNFNDKIHFADMNEIIQLKTTSLSSTEFSNKLSHLVDGFDILLWDVPEISEIKNNIESYFPIINQFHSLSVIIGRELTSKTEVERLKTFFENYNINLKGVLFNDMSDEVSTKKKWWKFW
jgi:hypothetical protein